MKAVFNRLKRLSLKQFFILLGVFISRPFWVIPTHQATAKTILICDKLFGRKHHQHGPENAYRHALWNMLIALQCYRVGRAPQEVVDWAEKVTSLHEKLAPNEHLETAMDLHNNQVGRQWFLEQQFHLKTQSEISQWLLERLPEVVRVESETQIVQADGQLVCLTGY